jgi:hypothetical protein
VGIATLFVTLPAISTTILYMDQFDLLENSNHLVRGTVVDQEAVRVSGSNMIYTMVTVEVSDNYKGNLPNQTVTVLNPGGTINKEGVKVFGAAEFKTGEAVLLFLKDSIKSFNYNGILFENLQEVMGYALGKYSVVRDQFSGRELLINSTAELSMVAPDAISGRLKSVSGHSNRSIHDYNNFIEELLN